MASLKERIKYLRRSSTGRCSLPPWKTGWSVEDGKIKLTGHLEAGIVGVVQITGPLGTFTLGTCEFSWDYETEEVKVKVKFKLQAVFALYVKGTLPSVKATLQLT